MACEAWEHCKQQQHQRYLNYEQIGDREFYVRVSVCVGVERPSHLGDEFERERQLGINQWRHFI